MVPSLLLCCESSVFVKENPDRKRRKAFNRNQEAFSSQVSKVFSSCSCFLTWSSICARFSQRFILEIAGLSVVKSDKKLSTTKYMFTKASKDVVTEV